VVSRLYAFEKERLDKLKEAAIQKKKEEMSEVTFRPKLIAKQFTKKKKPQENDLTCVQTPS